MPAIASLVINDGQTTPVAHTFAPVTTDGETAKWADRSPTIPAGFKTLSIDVSPPTGSRTVYKHTTGLMDPTVATVNAVDQVVRYNSGQLVLNFHPESTVQERKNFLAYMVNAMSNASVKLSVENLEPFY